MPYSGREIHLAARPKGEPQLTDFRLVEADVADPQDGEIVVRNLVMSVDPYMRGRMNDAKSYVPPFKLDAPLAGGAVGEVVASAAEGFAEGDVVLHQLGWREYASVPAKHATKVDTELASPSRYLGVLGMPGLTAYVGLLDIASLRDGDIVFVSGAAGAVGSLVGQIAKLRGHTVIGSAGSPEKVAHLKDDLGFDAAFDYHDGPARDLLRAAAPDGIDVYFDNVGGDHLEAALGAMNRGGRAALCGAIVGYNAEEPVPGPRNMFRIITQGLTLRGFTLGDWGHLAGEFGERMAGWFADGRITHDETVVDGIENAVEAFRSMMRGGNVGKMVVRTGG